MQQIKYTKYIIRQRKKTNKRQYYYIVVFYKMRGF